MTYIDWSKVRKLPQEVHTDGNVTTVTVKGSHMSEEARAQCMERLRDRFVDSAVTNPRGHDKSKFVFTP